MTTVADLLKIKPQGKSGATDGPLAGVELLSVYFSAHWCPPCRSFTPKLIKAYNAVNASGKRWEIVFVSLDRSQSDFDGYYKDMPWLTLDYDDQASKDSLAKKFGIKGIPALMNLNSASGELITSDGRGKVEGDETGANFPWSS